MTNRERPPLWLLDVDGVLNAVTGRPDRSIWPDWSYGRATADGERWAIWFSRSVIETIVTAHEQGRVEVRWLTTWGHNANGELREVLGLPKFEVAATEPRWARSTLSTVDMASHAEYAGADAVDPLTGQWWKFDVVRSLHMTDPDRRIIWTDDDIRKHRGVEAWMRKHTRSLVLSPPAHSGLTPKMIKKIDAYCGVSAGTT